MPINPKDQPGKVLPPQNIVVSKPKRFVTNVNLVIPVGVEAYLTCQLETQPLNDLGELVKGASIESKNMTLRQDKFDLYPDLVAARDAFIQALSDAADQEGF